MAKALNLAVPKLTSDDSAVVIQGVLNVVAGVAEFVPSGGFVASFMSVISSVIGLINGKKTETTIRDIVRAAVRESADEELEGKANAARAELAAAMRYLQSKHDQDLNAEDVTRMTTQIRITLGIALFCISLDRLICHLRLKAALRPIFTLLSTHFSLATPHCLLLRNQFCCG